MIEDKDQSRVQAGPKSAEEESEIARKAAQTRRENDPDAFQKMGANSGSQSHGGGRRSEEDQE